MDVEKRYSWQETKKNNGYQSYTSVTAWLLLWHILLVSRVTYSQWCCVTLLIERDNEKKIWMSVVCISHSITFMYYIFLVLRFTYSSIQFWLMVGHGTVISTSRTHKWVQNPNRAHRYRHPGYVYICIHTIFKWYMYICIHTVFKSCTTGIDSQDIL